MDSLSPSGVRVWPSLLISPHRAAESDRMARSARPSPSVPAGPWGGVRGGARGDAGPPEPPGPIGLPGPWGLLSGPRWGRPRREGPPSGAGCRVAVDDRGPGAASSRGPASPCPPVETRSPELPGSSRAGPLPGRARLPVAVSPRGVRPIPERSHSNERCWVCGQCVRIKVRYCGAVHGMMGVPGQMARRIDVTGAGGVRLAAWEFTDPPKAGGGPGRARPARECCCSMV